MKKLFKEIKERRLRKWLGIYISTCITVIAMTHLFSLRYHFPRYIFDILIIVVSFGFLTVLVAAWYHGKEDRQKVKKREMVFYSVILIAALVTAYTVVIKSPVRLLHHNARVVAVLPFINLSDSKEDEYFSDGITEDVLTNLSRIADLKVISRTSVMKYKNSKLSVKEIAGELGAGTILEGSVRKVGDKVRITGQLINANTDEHLWAVTYDRRIDDIFKVQSEIAERIAKELEARLAPKEKILIQSKPTDNIEAYALYLRGRELAERYTDNDNEKAVEYYKKALDIDPNYALAYAGLASAYDQKVRRYLYPIEWQDSAIMMSKKSLEINSDLAEGHASLAKSYEARGEYKPAIYHYEQAIRLNPNYSTAIHNLAVVHFNMGSIDEAYKLVLQSILLKPNDVFSHVLIGGIYQKFGCDELAEKWFLKALTLDSENLLAMLYITEHFLLKNDPVNAEKYFYKMMAVYPENYYVLFQGGKLEMLKGSLAASRKYFERANKINKDGEYEFAYVLMKLNLHDAANKILDAELKNYLDLENETSTMMSLNAKRLADIYAITGDKDKSVYWLSKAFERGWNDWKTHEIYPYMQNLKGLKQFEDVTWRMKFKADSMKIIARAYNKELNECR